MVNFYKTNKHISLLSLLLTVSIFFIDLIIPLGVDVGVMYIIPMFLISYHKDLKVLIFSTVLFTSLICLGCYFSSLNNSNLIYAYSNRGISISVILLALFFFHKFIKVDNERRLTTERFQQLYRKSIAPMVTTNLVDGTVMDINDEALLLFGFNNKEEVVNKVKSVDFYVDKKGREKMLGTLIKDGYIKDYVYKAFDVFGNEFWVESSIKLFKDEGFLEGVFHDVTKRVESEQVLHKALQEKEILLNEIHHRVKNNLQIVWGVLDIQQHRTKNKEVIASLEDSKIRIKTIGLLHENLYKTSDFTNIKFREYIDNLILYMNSIYFNSEKRIQIINKVESFAFSLEKSIPISLIISEIISNSYKHAFKSDDGIIEINGVKNNNQYFLTISDNGCGFDIDKEYDSIGLLLIKSLADQIDAAYQNISNKELGTVYKIIINE